MRRQMGREVMVSGDGDSLPTQLLFKVAPRDFYVGLRVIASVQMVRIVFSEGRPWARQTIVVIG